MTNSPIPFPKGTENAGTSEEHGGPKATDQEDVHAADLESHSDWCAKMEDQLTPKK